MTKNTDHKDVRGFNRRGLVSGLFLVSLLAGCTTKVSTKIFEIEHVDKANLENLSHVGTQRYRAPGPGEILYEGLEDGFAKISFATETDLRKTVDKKNLSLLYVNIQPCNTDLDIFSAKAFEAPSQGEGFIYSAFLPYDFDSEVLSNPYFVTKDKDKQRPKVVEEGACAHLGAGNMVGGTLMSNKMKVIEFDPVVGNFSWIGLKN